MAARSQDPAVELDLAAALEFALGLAHETGGVALSSFRTAFEIELKSDASPVTRADREIEALLRARIALRYPEHGIQGEEEAAELPDAPYQWLLDPIDGTRSFVTGNPLFGTLIALVHRGRPLLGVIDHPALGERWAGARGLATRYQDRPTHVRACKNLGEARLGTTSPYLVPRELRARFERLASAAFDVHLGGDCYLYGQLASGHLDLVCEAGLAAHDFCALVPVIEGAGGVITDWKGEPLDLESAGDVLAAGDKRVHAAALELLRP